MRRVSCSLPPSSTISSKLLAIKLLPFTLSDIFTNIFTCTQHLWSSRRTLPPSWTTRPFKRPSLLSISASATTVCHSIVCESFCRLSGDFAQRNSRTSTVTDHLHHLASSLSRSCHKKSPAPAISLSTREELDAETVRLHFPSLPTNLNKHSILIAEGFPMQS
jgi:hypothetical protein